MIKLELFLPAATTSLPETIGEVRNWDYRFCWIRDASMVIKVMSTLGHKNIAKRYLKFIINLMPDKDEKLQIMYGINGEKKLTEEFLEHLSGYKKFKPCEDRERSIQAKTERYLWNLDGHDSSVDIEFLAMTLKTVKSSEHYQRNRLGK